MLISSREEPFDDIDWIYEIKWDGCRCVVYLDKDHTILRNKRTFDLPQRFPELQSLYENVTEKCILDGELIVLKNGVPDFYELQRRTLLSDRFKIEVASTIFPATFIAYDCLYYKDESLLEKVQIERKMILSKISIESNYFAVSKYIEHYGSKLYNLMVEKELEGVVAKRKTSFYYMGKRTKDWIKFKRLQDEDFIICGYVIKGENVELVLGKYRDHNLIYQGHVSSGVKNSDIN